MNDKATGPYEPPMVYDPKQGKMVKPGASIAADVSPAPSGAESEKTSIVCELNGALMNSMDQDFIIRADFVREIIACIREYEAALERAEKVMQTRDHENLFLRESLQIRAALIKWRLK